MASDEIKNSKIAEIRSKIEENQRSYEKMRGEDAGSSWHAVSQSSDSTIGRTSFLNSIDFVGKNLENGRFALFPRLAEGVDGKGFAGECLLWESRGGVSSLRPVCLLLLILTGTV